MLSMLESPLLTSLSAPILISFGKKRNFFIFNCRERFLIATTCLSDWLENRFLDAWKDPWALH